MMCVARDLSPLLFISENINDRRRTSDHGQPGTTNAVLLFLACSAS